MLQSETSKMPEKDSSYLEMAAKLRMEKVAFWRLRSWFYNHCNADTSSKSIFEKLEP